MASASPSWSPGSRSRASRFRPTSSQTGGMSVATIGTPSAMASSKAPGEPSDREGRTKTSAAHRRSGTSARCPRSMTCASIPSSRTSRVSGPVVVPSRPAMTSRADGVSRSTAGIARIRTSSPFLCSCLATPSTTRSTVSIPSDARTCVRRASPGEPRTSGVPSSRDDVDPSPGHPQPSSHIVGDVGRDRVESGHQLRRRGVGHLGETHLPPPQ